jgi:hypothetical protein
MRKPKEVNRQLVVRSKSLKQFPLLSKEMAQTLVSCKFHIKLTLTAVAYKTYCYEFRGSSFKVQFRAYDQSVHRLTNQTILCIHC